MKVCKTIAIMQLLDDFCLSFDNLCSLLFQQIGHPLSKPELRALLDEIKDTAGVTLQEIDGRFRFMTNAILSVQDERSRINATDSDKFKVMKELVMIFYPRHHLLVFMARRRLVQRWNYAVADRILC